MPSGYCVSIPSECFSGGCVSISFPNTVVPAVGFRFRSEYMICQAVSVLRFLPNIFLVVVFRFRFEWVSDGRVSIPFPKCKSGGWVSISFPEIFLFPVTVDPFSEYIRPAVLLLFDSVSEVYFRWLCFNSVFEDISGGCASIPFMKDFSGGCVSIPNCPANVVFRFRIVQQLSCFDSVFEYKNPVVVFRFRFRRYFFFWRCVPMAFFRIYVSGGFCVLIPFPKVHSAVLFGIGFSSNLVHSAVVFRFRFRIYIWWLVFRSRFRV